MTASEKIAKAVRENPKAEPEKLARKIFSALSRADLLQLVIEEITHQQRSIVKELEDDALDALFTKGSTVTAAPPASGDDPLRSLFGQVIALGDGTRVLAERMTLDQWAARQRMLEVQRTGLDRAIEICRIAQEQIIRADATCLADIRQAA